MNLCNKLLLVGAAAVIVLASSECFAFKDEGFQWWTTTAVAFDINDGWGFVAEQGLRMGDDGGNLYHEYTDMGLVYKGLADWLELGANFRLISEKDNSGEWKQERRPHLNVLLKWQMLGMAMSDNSRFEYRAREAKDDVWRYRNKFTLKPPLELTPLKLKPYVADEIFITLNDDNVDKNRVFAGATFELAKGVVADIYYMWQADRTSKEWTDIQVLGTGLKFKF